MPDPHAVLDALDPEQREVATTLGGPVVVLAGAGTGKTRALTHRIAYGALTHQVDPKATLAVTFTTRAAAEMRSRLQALGVHGVQARTFHSAALRIAQHFWPQAYGNDLPPVHEQRFGFVAEAASRQGLRADTALIRDLTGEVSWAKVSNVTPGDYPRLAAAANRSVSGVEPTDVARILTSYEEILVGRGVIDFDDILLCTAALLTEHPEVATQVRGRYQHLLVDEYQDVSPLQRTVVGLLLGPSRDLCVVGDPRQSIHAFAGARSSYLTRFATEFPGATVLRLTRNYRSTPQVVHLANQVIASRAEREQGSAVGELRAVAPPGPEPAFAPADSDTDEAREVAAWLRGLADQGVAWDEMAVLFRINAQSPPLEAALSQVAIPYQVRGTERFYERPEIRQAIAALNRRAGAEHVQGRDAVLGVVDAVVGELGWTSTPPTGTGRVRERWESLNALVDLCQDLMTGESLQPAGTGEVAEVPEAVTDEPQRAGSLAELVAHIRERAAAQDAPTSSGVTLATMHASKGLEWDAVALVGLADGTVPFSLATTPFEIAEERRLLYVGITRARQFLRLSWPWQGRGRGRKTMSRFLTGLAPAQASTDSRPRTGRRARTQQSSTCRVCQGPITLGADRKLGRHADCESSYDENLVTALKQWRRQIADQTSVPAYVVFTDATLIAIAESLPTDLPALSQVPGVGAVKLERYGPDVLALVAVVATS